MVTFLQVIYYLQNYYYNKILFYDDFFNVMSASPSIPLLSGRRSKDVAEDALFYFHSKLDSIDPVTVSVLIYLNNKPIILSLDHTTAIMIALIISAKLYY